MFFPERQHGRKGASKARLALDVDPSTMKVREARFDGSKASDGTSLRNSVLALGVNFDF